MDLNKVYVVIPAYNEAENIVKVIKALKKEGYRNIVVVDDGSSDGTIQLAEAENIVLLKHCINRGPGAATQTGLNFAKLNGADFAVTLDADGQHYPKDIAKLLEKAPEYDLVFGSRFLSKNEIPFTKRIFNEIADFITFLLSTKWVSDSQTGFKVFSKKALDKIYIQTSGFEFCTEIFMQLRFHKLSFTEVPITVDYHISSQRKGQNFATGIMTLFKLFVEAITK